MNRHIFPHIALFLANSIYAINYLFAKDVMPDYISPTGFILLRVLGASIIFYIIHMFFIKEKVQRSDLLYIIVCAIFGVVINMLCFFEGSNITTPINASLIMITTPLIVYIISCFLSKKERTYRRFLGVLLGLFGAAFLITNGSFSFEINFGDLLIFLNACSYAFYLILIKSMMKKYHPITVLKTLFLIGLIIILPIGWPHISNIGPISIIPIDIIFKALFVIICTTCVAYFLNIYAISRLRATTVAFYIYLQPLLATLLSIVLGKDNLTLIKIVAASFIFIGVYFVVKRSIR